MREIKPGSKVVYCAPDGGFNALVVKVNGGEKESIDLTFIHPVAGLETVDGVPNVQHAKEPKEVQRLVGKKGHKKLETVTEDRLVAHGYWRP